MRPLTVITGIVLGSCLAITVSLAAVLFVFLFLGTEYPRVQDEFKPLLSSVLLFLSMTAISAVSFYSLVINHPARIVAQILLWSGVAATVWYYLP